MPYGQDDPARFMGNPNKQQRYGQGLKLACSLNSDRDSLVEVSTVWSIGASHGIVGTTETINVMFKNICCDFGQIGKNICHSYFGF